MRARIIFVSGERAFDAGGTRSLRDRREDGSGSEPRAVERGPRSAAAAQLGALEAVVEVAPQLVHLRSGEALPHEVGGVDDADQDERGGHGEERSRGPSERELRESPHDAGERPED